MNCKPSTVSFPKEGCKQPFYKLENLKSKNKLARTLACHFFIFVVSKHEFTVCFLEEECKQLLARQYFELSFLAALAAV